MPADQARPLSSAELQTIFEDTVDGRSPLATPPAPAPPPAFTPGQPLQIEALSRLNDQDFLRAAYHAILQRPPDPTGLQHYTAELAAGRSRVMVLGELRYSADGQRIGTPAPGLRARFLLHRAYRVRILGRLLRTLTGIAALPGVMRDLSRMSFELGSLKAEVRALRGVGAEDGQAHGQDRMTAEVHALRAAVAKAEQRLQAAIKQADAAERGQDRMQAALQAAVAEIEALSRQIEGEPWSTPVVALAAQLDSLSRRTAQIEKRAAGDSDMLHSASTAAEVLAAIRERMGWPQDAAALAASLEERLGDDRNLAVRAANAAETLGARVRAQEARLSLILHEMRQQAPGTPLAQAAAAQQSSLLDPLYVAFEDRFRGTRDDIKQRQRVYLDTLRAAGAGTATRPIVDVGSGRGELLELLRDEGMHARGVDLNGSMVALCAAAGLDCTEGDAVSYLTGLEPGSLGAVTGFHIIEHLPFAAMVALLDSSLRVLAPGGIVVFETPNPANLLVASRWFYLDPTHRNPLPGEMVAMIAEARGFVDIEVRPLHPMLTRFEARDEVLAKQLDALFHGPQDYALIARKA